MGGGNRLVARKTFEKCVTFCPNIVFLDICNYVYAETKQEKNVCYIIYNCFTCGKKYAVDFNTGMIMI